MTPVLHRQTRRWSGRAALLLAAVLLVGCGGLGGPIRGARLSDLAPPPATLPPADLAGSSGLLGGADVAMTDPNLDWGDGVLRPAGADGYERIDLALFDAPGGRHWGWVTRGRIYDQTRAATLPDRADAAVQVAGSRAFLVLEARSDGWLQIRYGHPDDRDRGLAWTRDDLAAGARASYLPWDRALADARGLVFRNADAAHNLRAGPGTDEEVLERLEGRDFDMAALEIRGDWMRVRVTEPPACAGSVAQDLLLGGSQTRERTGWIAWRSSDRGPWIRDAAGPRCGGGA